MTNEQKRERRVRLASELRTYETALERARHCYHNPSVTVILQIPKDFSNAESTIDVSEIMTWDRQTIVAGLEDVVVKKTEELKGLL